jgi:enterochelin esterase family protein
MPMPRGSVQVETVESTILKGNPPGDPHVRDLHVYLPPGYDSGSARYPVVWCLAGFTGRGRTMLNDGAWTPGIADRMDALIRSGRAKPMILALPDCFTHVGGSQYINSAGLGRYDDYIVKELVPLVDARYRTLPDARHRGVMGKSSGGYGALVLGMRHPDVFGAVACHSGDMFFDMCYTREFGPAIRSFRKAGGLEAWYRKFHAAIRKRTEEFAALDVVAMAAAYSPNPAAPPAFCDLPFDPDTGEIQGEVWAKWKANDPLTLLDRHADALKALRLLFLDCGTDDEWYLDLGLRQFVRRLQALGVKHEVEEFDDGHMNIPYRYDVSLPKLAEALAP